MTITQTVVIPADHRLVIDVPREVPSGRVILSYTASPEAVPLHPCPICAENIDPETGNPRYNAETRAGMQEVNAMLAGNTANTLKQFNSLEEMLEDLDSDN